MDLRGCVPQRGLALLHAGQLVKLRYEAFPHQRFGVRHATLHWISPTASLPSVSWTRLPVRAVKRKPNCAAC